MASRDASAVAYLSTLLAPLAEALLGVSQRRPPDAVAALAALLERKAAVLAREVRKGALGGGYVSVRVCA